MRDKLGYLLYLEDLAEVEDELREIELKLWLLSLVLKACEEKNIK
jgi:hypothetical protein